jgi:hypothetical protein
VLELLLDAYGAALARGRWGELEDVLDLVGEEVRGAEADQVVEASPDAGQT